MKRDKVDWLVVCNAQPRAWMESLRKENDQPKDISYQEKEVESTGIVSSVDEDSFVRLNDENVEYGDFLNENPDNDEEENDEPEFDFSSSTNEDENDDCYDDDENDDCYDDDN
ncbi:ribosomal L1 domain-containing protein CG13096-like [Ipomoea triloba]|uniref:ribosomal L1 domain-containing protein CG13096-like n=1 Tax=Ipomoea triloba TaxID=35885 RepID=UPI00125D51CE|nr:ribosomal L1 domain-containing protein CG13096-like [Ipomoea triloba]